MDSSHENWVGNASDGRIRRSPASQPRRIAPASSEVSVPARALRQHGNRGHRGTSAHDHGQDQAGDQVAAERRSDKPSGWKFIDSHRQCNAAEYRCQCDKQIGDEKCGGTDALQSSRAKTSHTRRIPATEIARKATRTIPSIQVIKPSARCGRRVLPTKLHHVADKYVTRVTDDDGWRASLSLNRNARATRAGGLIRPSRTTAEKFDGWAALRRGIRRRDEGSALDLCHWRWRVTMLA